MRILLIAPVLLASVFSTDSGACPNRPEDETLEIAESALAEAGREIAKLAQESDLIVIGRAVEVSEERVPISDLKPDEPPVIGDMVYGEVLLEPIQVIKGSLSEAASFTYTRNESERFWSCGPLGKIRDVYLQPSYRFIFYIRGSEVLRTNQVVDWFDGLDYETEISLIPNGS